MKHKDMKTLILLIIKLGGTLTALGLAIYGIIKYVL